jgi:hypothetical protein
MASKTDVTGRAAAKAARVKHIGVCLHEIKRVLTKGIKGAGRFQWFCEECGGYREKRTM